MVSGLTRPLVYLTHTPPDGNQPIKEQSQHPSPPHLPPTERGKRLSVPAAELEVGARLVQELGHVLEATAARQRQRRLLRLLRLRIDIRACAVNTK